MRYAYSVFTFSNKHRKLKHLTSVWQLSAVHAARSTDDRQRSHASSHPYGSRSTEMRSEQNTNGNSTCMMSHRWKRRFHRGCSKNIETSIICRVKILTYYRLAPVFALKNAIFVTGNTLNFSYILFQSSEINIWFHKNKTKYINYCEILKRNIFLNKIVSFAIWGGNVLILKYNFNIHS